MPKLFERRHISNLHLWLGGVLLCFFVFYKNTLSIAPPKYFNDFQHDSESLVLGKIIADKAGLKIAHGANLSYVTVGEFSYDPAHVYQAYELLDDSPLPDLEISTLDLSDNNWIHGFLRSSAGLVVPASQKGIKKYVGHTITVGDGIDRRVESVEDEGQYVNVKLLGPKIDGAAIGFPNRIKISGHPAPHNILAAYPYVSQYGLQGKLFSALHNTAAFEIRDLYKLNVALLALIITGLAFCYARIVSFEFSILFFASVILSPWMTSYARNLYWVPFTWFLPALIAAMYHLTTKPIVRVALLALLYLSFVIKCLSGYEYISSVILFAASTFGFTLIASKSRTDKTQALKEFLLVCIVGVLGFMTALLLHAGMRGDTILKGLAAIYEQDVKRRTYADPASFPPAFAQSLLASPWQVVKIYLVDWDTEVIKGVSGKYFVLLVATSVATVIYKFSSKHLSRFRDLGVLLAFALGPLSWFILAKGHSFIHTHLNYALWYFGFVAACLFVTYNGVRILVIRAVAWLRAANELDY
ncbi:hypothetical protein [Cupriavidus necator]|uniref:hypothetical protein n=1 Tax=Cupriavidus necator TaxID=106590 RepID=UPI0005B4D63B|nr:hypothetical protein [Cupriavidus necator]